MRTVLILTFIAMSCYTLAQSPEKGGSPASRVMLTVYHADGTNEIVSMAISDPSLYHTGITDTTVYTLDATDTLVADFFMINYSIPDWPFHEELVYGDPIVDTSISGHTSMGGGDAPYYHKIWSFTDSAMFSYYFVTPDHYTIPLHVVQLIYNQLPAVVTEEEPPLPIAVFPNPSSGDLYIQLPADLSAELSLTDASGRQVKAWKCNESYTLDLSPFESGNYVLRIVIDGKVRTFRVEKVGL